MGFQGASVNTTPSKAPIGLLGGVFTEAGPVDESSDICERLQVARRSFEKAQTAFEKDRKAARWQHRDINPILTREYLDADEVLHKLSHKCSWSWGIQWDDGIHKYVVPSDSERVPPKNPQGFRGHSSQR